MFLYNMLSELLSLSMFMLLHHLLFLLDSFLLHACHMHVVFPLCKRTGGLVGPVLVRDGPDILGPAVLNQQGQRHG